MSDLNYSSVLGLVILAIIIGMVIVLLIQTRFSGNKSHSLEHLWDQPIDELRLQADRTTLMVKYNDGQDMLAYRTSDNYHTHWSIDQPHTHYRLNTKHYARINSIIHNIKNGSLGDLIQGENGDWILRLNGYISLSGLYRHNAV